MNDQYNERLNAVQKQHADEWYAYIKTHCMRFMAWCFDRGDTQKRSVEEWTAYFWWWMGQENNAE